jgi:hypothetical protein
VVCSGFFVLGQELAYGAMSRRRGGTRRTLAWCIAGRAGRHIRMLGMGGVGRFSHCLIFLCFSEISAPAAPSRDLLCPVTGTNLYGTAPVVQSR